jgi:RimJ/RimL family protein N-acetyltransferase
VDRDQLARRWPQFALHIASGGIVLQTPTDSELSVLARRAAAPGAVLPATESHFVTWIQERSPSEIEAQRIARARSNRDLTTRPGWTLDLAVMAAGQPVGMQSLSGFDQWPLLRIAGTTSWLLAPFQHRGLGTRCRAGVLELAFSYLNVESVKSWVLEENRASISVSTRLGYELVDRHDITEYGRRFTEHVYRLDRDSWLQSPARRQYAPVITGTQRLVELLAS